MKKYFFLQTKRQLKFFPAILLVTVAMLLGIAVILSATIGMNAEKDEMTRFKVAITGDTDSNYIDLGLAALKTVDNTRFTLEFVVMSEDEAKELLAEAKISAYAVLPENFIENALAGFIDPVKYVTSAGSSGVATLFKNEITDVITNMVVYSEKGSYGIYDAMKDNGVSDANKHLNRLSIEYVDLILHRSDLLDTEETGVSLGLSTVQYYVCGALLLIIVIIGLPFGSVCIKSDNSLERLLVSRGFSPLKQMVCELIAHIISVSFIILALIIGISVAFPYLSEGFAFLSDSGLTEIFPFVLLRLVPVLIMICTLDILMFELADSLISGILIHFFTSLSLCYLAGCFYPRYAFPALLQKISALLPTGVAFDLLASTFTDIGGMISFAALMLYTIAFFALAVLMRDHRLNGRRGIKA